MALSQVKKTIRNYAALSRISNLPTCLSNLLLGAGLGVVLLQGESGWPDMLGLFLAVAMIYIAGMAMNDIFDRKFDHHHSITRPLVAGQISLSNAIIYMLLLGLAGISILCVGYSILVGAAGIGLVLTITAYNYYHKKKKWAVWLMGACRSWVYLLGLLSSLPPKNIAGHLGLGSSLTMLIVVLFVVGIGLYTAGITLVARLEHLPLGQNSSKKKYASYAMICLGISSPLLGYAQGWPEDGLALTGLWSLTLLTGGWLWRAARFAIAGGKQTRHAVMTWLSGMALVDALALMSLGLSTQSLISVGCFVCVWLWHKTIAGT